MTVIGDVRPPHARAGRLQHRDAPLVQRRADTAGAGHARHGRCTLAGPQKDRTADSGRPRRGTDRCSILVGTITHSRRDPARRPPRSRSLPTTDGRRPHSSLSAQCPIMPSTSRCSRPPGGCMPSCSRSARIGHLPWTSISARIAGLRPSRAPSLSVSGSRVGTGPLTDRKPRRNGPNCGVACRYRTRRELW